MVSLQELDAAGAMDSVVTASRMPGAPAAAEGGMAGSKGRWRAVHASFDTPAVINWLLN